MSDRGARLQRKNLALTYPRAQGAKEDLLQFLVTQLAAYEVKYGIVCQELHQDGETHFHCFIMLGRKLRITDMNAFDWNGNHPHIEEARSPREWIQYVKKDGNWVDVGEDPLKKARMEKREKIRFLIEKTLDEAIDSNQFTIFEIAKRQQLIRDVQNSKRLWPTFMKRNVLWFYGPTGTGKTRRAVEIAERNYKDSWCILTGDLRTFLNGYTNQRCVIFDDVRAGTLRFERLLQLTDGYRIIVNVKGGFTEWLAECIIFTAPVKPDEMFVNKETHEPWDHLDQLERRIDEIREFPCAEQTELIYDAPPAPGPHDVPFLPGETQEQVTPAPTEGFPEDESVIVGDAFISF